MTITTRQTLEQRVAKLESQLAEFQKVPFQNKDGSVEWVSAKARSDADDALATAIRIKIVQEQRPGGLLNDQ